jgi:hypothetical protein
MSFNINVPEELIQNVSRQDLIVNGNVNINLGTEERLFDTIVIRRPTGDNAGNNDYHITLRELQMWVDNSNVLLTSTSSGNNDTGKSYNEISNNTTFMFWNTKVSNTHYSSSAENQASNIFDNIINNTSTSFHSVGDVTGINNVNVSIYII